MPYTVKYANMQVTALTEEWHQTTCGYWYKVTSGATAHTAFHTKRGLERWLEERGLELDGTLPEVRGDYGTVRVIGEYYSTSHGEFLSDDPSVSMGPGDFYALRPVVITAAMSNGRYTLALITEDDGGRTVHTLNPNVKTRIEITGRDTAAMRGLLS